MNIIDVNNLLFLPSLDDISLDIHYIEMPLSLFCKTLGINETDLREYL